MTEENLRLAHLLADAGAMVWYAGRDELVVDESAARLFGVHKSELGEGLAGLLARLREDTRDRVVTALERLVVDGTILDLEVPIDLPDRARRVLWMRAVTVHDEPSDRVVFGIKDITLVAVAREETAALRATAAERDQRLHRAIVGLEGTVRERDELAIGLSHEIRTRLNAVLGMTRLVLDGAVPREVRDQLALVEAAGRELLAFTADTIDVGSTTDAAGELPAVNTRAFVNEAIGELATVVRERQLKVRAHVDRNVPDAIRVDAVRLGRVLHYVLRHAIEATATGEIVVEVHATALLGSLHDLAIEVSHPTPPESATPLGLFLATRLTTRLGGRFVVVKEAGTRVRIELSVDETTAATSAPIELDPMMGVKHPLRVLVAEDNPINRRVIDAFLRKLGYTSRHAANGREAIAMVDHDPFDLVLMDIHMPEVDGLEATRVIRRRVAPGTPPRIVALTANALPSDRAACLKAGCDEYLTKPVTLEALAAALRATPETPRLASGAAALDEKKLARLEAALGGAKLAEILAVHETDARESVHALQDATEATAIGRLARTLAFTCDVLGAAALGVTCAQLASAADRGDVASIPGLVGRATRELAQVRVALEPRLR